DVVVTQQRSLRSLETCDRYFITRYGEYFLAFGFGQALLGIEDELHESWRQWFAEIEAVLVSRQFVGLCKAGLPAGADFIPACIYLAQRCRHVQRYLGY